MKYSLRKNLRYLLGDIWKRRKPAVFALFLRVPLMVGMPLFAAYVPKYILQMLEQGRSALYISIGITVLTLLLLAVYLTERMAYLFLEDMYYKMRALVLDGNRGKEHGRGI